MVRRRREPRRLPVHVRPRPAVAEEPPRQRRQRGDHRRRRRRPEPQLQRQLGLRQRGLLARSGRRDLPRSERALRARDAGAGGPDRPHQADDALESALVRASGCCTRRAGRSARWMRTTRCTWRSAAPTRSRRSRASTRASRPTRCTSPTARRRTTPRAARARSRTRPSSGRGRRAPGSCSRTTRRWSRQEFENALPFHVALARSASRPANPVSPVGIDVEPFYLDQDDIDPQNGQQSLFDFKFARVLRQSAAGAGAGQAQPRQGHAPLSGQRRPRPERLDQRVERRRALRGRQRRLLPRGRRPGDGHEARRQREGVVHGRPRAERLVHVPRRLRHGAPRADRRRRGLQRRVAGPAARAALPLVLRERAGRQRRRVRRLRRGRQRPHGAGQPRRPEPLRRRRLVHGQRRRDARAGLGPGQRVAARDAGAAGGARLRQRGRSRALRRQGGRPAVHAGPRRAAVRPVREPAVPGRPGDPGALPRPVRLGRQPGRPDRVLVRGEHHHGRRRAGPGDGRAVPRRRHRQPVRRPVVELQRSRQRPEPDHELVVHRDRRLPAGDRSGGQLPAVRELAGGRVPERAVGPVRPAHGPVVHVVQPGRRGLQAAHPDDHGPGGRRDAGVLDELQPRARLRLHDRRGAHGRPGQLDDAAGPERPHEQRPEHR